MREAFKSITELNYSYTPVKELVVPNNEVKIEKVKVVPFQLVEDMVEEKESEAIEKIVEIKEEDKVINNIEEQEVANVKKVTEVEVKEVTELAVPTNLLYAQPNSYGFQLIDSTPKVVYILLKTGMFEIYILKNKNGILFKKDNQWIAEYYEANKMVKRVLEIKF